MAVALAVRESTKAKLTMNATHYPPSPTTPPYPPARAHPPDHLTTTSGKPHPTTQLGFSLPPPQTTHAIIARVPGPILIVDDDAPFLSLAARILHNLGIANIVTAKDAATALRTANTTKPTAALIDIGLPDRNGIDLAHELAQLPWHPHIVLTSTDRDAISTITADHRTPLPFIPKDDLATAPLHKMLIPEPE